MTFRRLWPIGLLALALASTGCDSGRKNPPDTLVRVLNATANYPALSLKRGPAEVQPLVVDFLGGNQATWDTDTYNFHVTYFDLGTQREVEAEQFSKQVVTGTWYTFVLYQKGGLVTHAVLEAPPSSTTATDAKVQAIHVVEGAPTVNFYLVAPGTDITGATPWGTLPFEGTLPQRTVPAADYEVVATEAGNPAHVLYTSASFTLSAGANVTFALTPDSGEGIAPFSMTVLNDTSSVFVDPSVSAGLRVINGAWDRQPRDVAINSEFTPPLFPGTVFVTPTPYLPVPPSNDLVINVTPPGNPGVLELTGDLIPIPGAKYTLMFTGATGALILNLPQDSLRRIKSQAKLNFYDVAGSCGLCDILLLAPGTDPNTQPALDPIFGTDPYPQTSLAAIVPIIQFAGDYEVTLRISGTQTIVSGPTPITLKDAGIYGIVLSDNPNGTTIDMTLIDDFQ
jgi:hypothetical protein